MTPTQRTLKLMRDHGFYCEIVEHWNAHFRVRQDLMGFADILCLKEEQPPTLIQVTSTSNMSARVQKISEEPRALLSLRTGFRILVHGWASRVDDDGWGTAERSWQCKVHLVSEADFSPDVVADMQNPTC